MNKSCISWTIKKNSSKKVSKNTKRNKNKRLMQKEMSSSSLIKNIKILSKNIRNWLKLILSTEENTSKKLKIQERKTNN